MRPPSVSARYFLLLAIVLLLPLRSPRLHAQSNEAPHPADNHFDYQPWLDDFHELLGEMEAHYAGLEWAIHDRHMDLPELRKETEDKIKRASNASSEKRILEQFLNAFGDGHLSITWQPTEVGTAALPEKSGPVKPLCARLGYENPSKKGIEFSTLQGFSEVPGEGSNWFSGGLLTLDHARIGVIRIARFDEHGFPLACENTVRAMHLADDSTCDRHCAQGIALRTANLLTEAIVHRAQQLRSLGASALLVDVTRNDGGDDWNEAVARSLSNIPLMDEHRGFIKNPAWTAKLENDLRAVEGDLDKGARPRQVLENAAIQLRKDIALSKETCDRSQVFENGTLNCSLVVDGGLFWSGLLPYAKVGYLAGLQSRTTLFYPLQYRYTESHHHLPLIVAVDSHSWSSAERFAALLQDNRAATIIGELTGGAGCGFVDGGIPTTLTHSHARVNMPNCVGFRKDGSNANDGVTPDVYIPWAQRDTPYTRAKKARIAMEMRLSAHR